MNTLLKPRISDTARASVANRWGYLPPEAAELAAGWLTLLEEVDARYSDPAPMTAMVRERPHSPEDPRCFREAHRRDRAVFERGLIDLLNHYPAPMIVTAPIPPCGLDLA